MNNEEQIEALKNALREVVQIIIQKGEPLSDEFKLLLTQVMEHVATRITELRSTEGGNPPPVPPLEPGPYPSSNINSFKYDPKTQKLFVKFMGKDTADEGPVYGYDKVPPFIYDVFRRGAVAPKTSGRNKWHTWKRGVTPSLGAAMSALIKSGGFQYQRLS